MTPILPAISFYFSRCQTSAVFNVFLIVNGKCDLKYIVKKEINQISMSNSYKMMVTLTLKQGRTVLYDVRKHLTEE